MLAGNNNNVQSNKKSNKKTHNKIEITLYRRIPASECPPKSYVGLFGVPVCHKLRVEIAKLSLHQPQTSDAFLLALSDLYYHHQSRLSEEAKDFFTRNVNFFSLNQSLYESLSHGNIAFRTDCIDFMHTALQREASRVGRFWPHENCQIVQLYIFEVPKRSLQSHVQHPLGSVSRQRQLSEAISTGLAGRTDYDKPLRLPFTVTVSPDVAQQPTFCLRARQDQTLLRERAPRVSTAAASVTQIATTIGTAEPRHHVTFGRRETLV